MFKNNQPPIFFLSNLEPVYDFELPDQDPDQAPVWIFNFKKGGPGNPAGTRVLRTDWTKNSLDQITGMIPVLFYAADIFSFAHHAWASETASVSSAGGESGEAEADISWFRSELARLRFDLQGKLSQW